MPASAWDKFLLLSWKNWLIQLRHPIQTLFEIVVPVAVIALVVVVRGLVDVSEELEDIRYPPLNKAQYDVPHFIGINPVLAYSPYSPAIDRLIEGVQKEFGFLNRSDFPNALSLEENGINTIPFASFEFDDSLSGAETLPDVINYAIRFPSELRTNETDQNSFSVLFNNWATDFILSDGIISGPRNRKDDNGGEPPGYIRQGFIAVQNSLERQIIYQTTDLTPDDLPDLYVQRFPYPAYVNDILGDVMEFMMPQLFLIAFLYNCINIIKYIAVEKELQLKEAMKIMGLPSYMHWLAWFVKCMLFQVVIISILTGMFKITFSARGGLGVFTNTNWIIIWLFLFLFAMAAVTFSFMFSTFFNKANIASIVGSITWFVLLLPYTILNTNYNSTGATIKLVASLLCNSGVGFGFKVMSQWESAGDGVQWNNLFKPVSPDDDLTLGAIMLVMLIASVIQMLIALYVEKVKPGEFGIAEKFYFPFQISFWTGQIKTKDHEADLYFKSEPNFEAEPTDKNAGIQVRGLRKVYDKKVAVKGLNLNMYEDQITVLLGHNGAGKSTTMSMLTGLFQPTSGTAYIDGKDIRCDLNSVRSSLGFCPQANVLFNELTVKEHITFFSKLKGLKKSSEIDEQIRKYVTLLELTPKLNAQSHTLSGGMKRKLSIGIALCGGSKIVMCDEPTSGMDPAARRALWDVLIQEKKGRTILLTTHFMDEADVLGDRIAIMAEGDLKTVGTSFFLKKKFGVGYRLVCVKSNGCNPTSLTQLLAKYIPGIEIETNIGSELTYVLNEDYIGQFKVIFADLEMKATELGISSFGVSLTTLEEVFLKVGTDTQAEIDNSPPSENIKLNDDGLPVATFTQNGFGSTDTAINYGSKDILDETNFVYGAQLYFSQIIAMISKKGLYSIRNYVLMLIQIIIPAFFIIIAMVTAAGLSGNQELPQLSISLDTYITSVTVAQPSFAIDSKMESIFKSYNSIISETSGDHSFEPADRFFQDYMLNQYSQSISDTNLFYLVGATFSDSNITAWFNNQGYHTAPLTINLINNAIWRSSSGNAKKTINVVNKPMPYTTESRLKQLEAGNNVGFQIAFNAGFSMAFVTAMFVMFYIKERVSRAKLLQFVSGVNKVIFWLTSFVIDYLVFILISIIFIGVLAAYQEEGYKEPGELARNFLLIIVFGFAALPFTYVLSFIFQIPSTGLVRLAILYIITGVFAFMAYFILSIESLGLTTIADVLGWIFLLFPHYSLSRGMSNLNVLQSTINVCETRCTSLDGCKEEGVSGWCKLLDEVDCSIDWMGIGMPEMGTACVLKDTCCSNNFFDLSSKGIGVHLLALVIIALVSFFALFAIEFRWLQNIFFSFKKDKRPLNIPESEDGIVDSDVMAEKNKIRSVSTYLQATNNLVVKDLTKYYGKMLAVNQLCVGVNKGECFGLLGVNGAGKTSTFKMLTGDETISSGEAWIEGVSIKTAMNKVHQKIGYCPQFDALLDELTGRETLRIFALLKGIPRKDIHRVSMQLATEFNFVKHLDKRIKAYSGGNKRKLSTALSMIGDPSVIYLDEPTSGMDVGARRQLWNMVIKARNAGKSVVLTSHSMEECEVLCTRLAIMVNGEFKCLGSTQHLKNKFSKGFFMTIKVGIAGNEELNQRVTVVKNFVEQNFAGAVLKEEYMDILTYHIHSSDVKWSQLFGLMEDNKARLNIADYSLGQTSLEQVFLFFTKYQRNEAK